MGDVRRTALNGIQQGLILQVADENMLFMFRQIDVILAVIGQVDLFRTPEERQLLLDQAFKNLVFLNIVTGNVNVLTEKHRLSKSIKFVTIKCGVCHTGSISAQRPPKALQGLRLNFTRAAGTVVVFFLYIFLRIFHAITGVVIVQSLHTVFVGGEQIFQQLLHRYLAAETGRVVVGVSGDRLINELLHNTNQLQVTVVVRNLPQQLVIGLQCLVVRYDLFENAVFTLLNTDVTAWWFDTVGGVGNLR